MPDSSYFCCSENTVVFCHSGYEDGPYEYYEDLGSSIYGYGISYGTLFRILQKVGFDVSGDVDYYMFYGANGDIYENSYDFHKKNPKLEIDVDSYYYLKIFSARPR